MTFVTDDEICAGRQEIPVDCLLEHLDSFVVHLFRAARVAAIEFHEIPEGFVANEEATGLGAATLVPRLKFADLFVDVVVVVETEDLESGAALDAFDPALELVGPVEDGALGADD